MKKSDEAAALTRLGNLIELTNVQTVQLEARLAGEPPPPGTSAELELHAELSPRIQENAIAVLGTFRVTARASGAEPYFEARYGVIGHYASPEVLSQEQVEQFAKAYALVHLWPYLRAFVQGACGQMGIAPLVLPPYRAGRGLQVPAQPGR